MATNGIQPIPQEEIKEHFRWREWFKELGRLVQVTRADLSPSAITVGASPFTTQNTGSYPYSVIVSGGTVSAIDFSRDGSTFYSVGQTAGMFLLSSGDRLRITYTVVPTMTLVPR